jgi:hypothetical protein
MLLIAKDDYPLEQIKGHPIINLIRRVMQGSHFECHSCYEKRKGIEVFRTESPERHEHYF